MTFQVRRAMGRDARAACQVVRRSIAELCAADHHDDEETLAEWLANKNVSSFEGWICSGRHIALVAKENGGVCAFGLLNREGSLSLLYVSPDTRFQEVSKALLGALEQEALDAGIQEITLASTITARHFYLRCGYAMTGDPYPGFGVTLCYPMSKRLRL